MVQNDLTLKIPIMAHIIDFSRKFELADNGIFDPYNCEASMKNTRYEEIKFLDWEIELKFQITRELKDITENF